MNCPKCGGDTYVTRTIDKTNKVFRYRKCKLCKSSFTTTEMTSDGWNYQAIVDEIRRLVNK